jgi:hypothetical protein
MPDVLPEWEFFILEVKREEHQLLIEISQVLKGQGGLQFVLSERVFESVEILLGLFIFVD